MSPKTWSKQEIIDRMQKTAAEVREHCLALNQPCRLQDVIEQIFEDLDEAGLIERTP